MSSPTLRIAYGTIEGGVVVHAAGEIDLLTAPDLQAGLEAACARARSPEVVVADLTKVGFMGSAGLAVLMDIDKLCRVRHTPLCVVATTPGVVRPLEVTGLDRILSIVGSLDGVIRSA